ncbi:hypothetical protein G7046_g7988 [Stylonectria norvegica]|nr:hypothetical protein G7046_g7988 [Stylonectria norvegica]
MSRHGKQITTILLHQKPAILALRKMTPAKTKTPTVTPTQSEFYRNRLRQFQRFLLALTDVENRADIAQAAKDDMLRDIDAHPNILKVAKRVAPLVADGVTISDKEVYPESWKEGGKSWKRSWPHLRDFAHKLGGVEVAEAAKEEMEPEAVVAANKGQDASAFEVAQELKRTRAEEKAPETAPENNTNTPFPFGTLTSNPSKQESTTTTLPATPKTDKREAEVDALRSQLAESSLVSTSTAVNHVDDHVQEPVELTRAELKDMYKWWAKGHNERRAKKMQEKVDLDEKFSSEAGGILPY